MSAAALVNTEPHFQQYDKIFQEKIFQSLVTDKQWAQQIYEVMQPEFFELNYLKYLTQKYFNYFKNYRCFPTMQLLISIIREDLKDGNEKVLRDQIVEFLHRMRANPNPGDLEYVKDKTLDFCKKQAFKEALEKAVEMVSEDKFESVVGLMKDAVSVGMPSTVGHDFFEDLEARFIKINRQVCPTGLAKLDSKDILQGGLGRGELGVVVANTGVGKSHWLVAMGAAALRAGKTVVHYTFELSEHQTGLRYDSHLCNMPSNEVQDRKEEVLAKYEKGEFGKLFIKYYPTGSASVLTIRNHIEKLMLKNHRPSLILIDYADIMKSSKSYDSLRHELKLIYEELRNAAGELNVPIWTASQANRSSAGADIVGLENMSEAYGKAMVADVIISLSRKAEEKATGQGRLYVAKNRAGRDGIVFPVNIDTARSKFKILDDSELTLNEVMDQSENDMRNTLRKKWKEVKKMEGERA